MWMTERECTSVPDARYAKMCFMFACAGAWPDTALIARQVITQHGRNSVFEKQGTFDTQPFTLRDDHRAFEDERRFLHCLARHSPRAAHAIILIIYTKFATCDTAYV